MIGIVIAFQNYNPTKGFFNSQFVGLENFEYVSLMPDTLQVLWNTVFTSVLKIILGLLVPVLFAILLDLVRRTLVSGSYERSYTFRRLLVMVILSGS